MEGGFYPLNGTQVAASSWTSSNSYSNISITVLLAWGAERQGTAYLTTRVGAGTTVSDEIARANFVFPSATAEVTVFSDLNLPAGTFFLVLTGPSAQDAGGWRDAYDCGTICSYAAPVISLDASTIRNEDLIGHIDPGGYAPAFLSQPRNGIHGEPYLQYSVVAVPEASSLLAGGSGLLYVLLLFALRTKRSPLRN